MVDRHRHADDGTTGSSGDTLVRFYLPRGRKGLPTSPWCQKVGGPFRSSARKCGMRNAERGMGKEKWQMTKWQMADDKWQMTNGKWQMAGGGWRMADGG